MFMNINLQRELYVAKHGQSFKFRVVKYIVILGIMVIIFQKYSWEGVLYALLFGGLMGITLHLFLSWKTNGWRNSWGIYKKIPIPEK
jgi:hypothetical protein